MVFMESMEMPISSREREIVGPELGTLKMRTKVITRFAGSSVAASALRDGLVQVGDVGSGVAVDQ
jgi:hypothetical protein